VIRSVGSCATVSFSKLQMRALPKLAKPCDFSVAGSVRKGIPTRGRVRAVAVYIDARDLSEALILDALRALIRFA
jgi:hypothetical protein